MEGHQRAIMGNMTVEEIYKDRQTFSTRSIFSTFFSWSIFSVIFSTKSIFSTILSTAFSCRVFDVASQDLYSMGIMVVSYTIKDVSDEVRKMAILKDPCGPSMILC